jgi:hypothetical protein
MRTSPRVSGFRELVLRVVSPLEVRIQNLENLMESAGLDWRLVKEKARPIPGPSLSDDTETTG